jgi:peptidyl-prolyl cis-trans isomerase B (cyclophilin B)
VAKSKERQRQLARAKWERQQVRRTKAAVRRRRISLVVGVITGLIVTAFLIWLVIHIVSAEDKRNPNPVVPTDSGFSTNLKTPESNSPPSSGAPTPTTGATPKTKGTTPTPTSTKGGKR